MLRDVHFVHLKKFAVDPLGVGILISTLDKCLEVLLQSIEDSGNSPSLGVFCLVAFRHRPVIAIDAVEVGQVGAQISQGFKCADAGIAFWLPSLAVNLTMQKSVV